MKKSIKTLRNKDKELRDELPFNEFVTKLENESNLQYAVFLLYCESKSITDLTRQLAVEVGHNEGRMSTVLRHFKANLSKRTLERWSSKYFWVKRKDEQVRIFSRDLVKIIQEDEQKKAEEFIRALSSVNRLIPEDGRRFNGRNFKKNKEGCK